MKIFIITMDDPIHTRSFIKFLIDNRGKDIIGLAVSKGDRLTIGKNRSKLAYLFSLLLIMGVFAFIKNTSLTLIDKLKKILSQWNIVTNPSILFYAKSRGIPVWDISTPNNKNFIQELRELQPDIIINQSQSIIRKELLSVPKIGIINRHNALLPKNRGRLTPFWVLFKEEKETGVTIHFVTEGIDDGDIIVQEKFSVLKTDTFNTIVRKNYEIVPVAMLKALDIIETGKYTLINNDNSQATYNTIPNFKQALFYRLRSIKNIFSFIFDKS